MATPYRLKRSAVSNKRPSLADLELGELAFNFYDGHLFAERDTGGVGIGTTVALLTPWIEDYGGGTLRYSGVVTATTYHGDQIVGTPTLGNFRSGAMASPTVADKTKDHVEEINYILGKLVPTAPGTISGVAVNIDDDTIYHPSGSSVAQRPLCAGFSPVNNTSGGNPSAGTAYWLNLDNTVTTDYITQKGPADSGTLTGYVNTTSIGSTALKVSFGLYDAGSDNGIFNPSGITSTFGIQVANEKDYADVAGIASNFYEVLDVRILDAVAPVGYSSCFFTWGAYRSGTEYFYEEDNYPAAPDMTFSAVTTPATSDHVVNYSSGVPHYTQSTDNAFTYVISVLNATGHFYYSTNNRLLWAENATTGFTRPDTYKTFNEFIGAGTTQGTHPPTQNFGVGTAVTCAATHTPNNVHATISSNHFHRWDCWTPYGRDIDERATLSGSVNIMGTSADWTNNVDEDAIECTVGSLINGSATRVNAGATGDNPTPVQTAWNASATPAVYEAIVRGGDLRHDVTNYSTGYFPVGPDFSSGRTGNQYFQVKFTQESVSGFTISYSVTAGASTGCAGCWVCMPNNSSWITGLSNTNGWADMFAAAPNSGAPRNAFPGCSSGGVMDNDGGTFTCTFGTESSSNASDNVILVRFKLTSGQSISDISFADT